ncbi:MAG: FAD-dependent oxidoreductase [Phycisphaerae bacterium]
MAEYTLPQRRIPLDDSWDVIVVGGGPAGCTAATASAREGARTLLIEATGCLGGMGTSGLVPAWCPFSDKERIIYGGLAEKVFHESRKGVPHVPPERMDWVPINPEQLKRVYDDMVTEAGATVLFNTLLADVQPGDSGPADSLIVAGKGGLAAYRAKVYVDCTGDADLASWAGAGFQMGDKKTGELQPATHCFIFSNVDTYAFLYETRLHAKDAASSIGAILESGRWPRIADRHLCNTLIGPGTVGFNAGHLWDVDNTDPVSISRALMEGRKLAADFRDALAEFAPKAFANAYLAVTGSLMGCRETRRIVGDYELTIDDYLARRTFDDEICRNSYWIDIHTAKEEISASREDWSVVSGRYEHYGPGESHGIPYRCLRPKGLSNVLVAGRSISCDRPTQGSVRVMPTCLAMGEAAGLAASLAAGADEPDIRDVDIADLRGRLRKYGAYLP